MRFPIRKGLHVFVIISAAAGILLFCVTMDDQTWEGLEKLQAKHILLALLLIMATWGLDALRFRLLANAIGKKLTFLKSAETVFAGFFVSAVTPFQSGGSLVQVYMLYQEGVPVGKGSALCLVRSSLDLLVFLLAVPFTFSLEQLRFEVFISTIVPCVLVLLLICIIHRPKKLKRMTGKAILWLRQRIPSNGNMRSIMLEKLIREMTVLDKGLRMYLAERRWHVIIAGLLTLIITCLRFAIAPVLIAGVGVRMPVMRAFLLQFILALALYIAPTPGASGIAELGFASLFASSLPRQLLSIYVLLWRFFTSFLGVTLGGIIVLYRLGIRDLKSIDLKGQQHKAADAAETLNLQC